MSSDPGSNNGFATIKQLSMYLEFAAKTVTLMQSEIMHHILGESVYPLDLEGTHKKLAKLHKALQYMERHKQNQPYFSSSF
jgi:hypothetical protein